MFWSNALAIPKHNVCTHGSKHQIPFMRDGLQGTSYLEGLDCLGTVLLVEAGGLRDLRMADGLVDAKNWRGSGMPTGVLDAWSTEVRILPMVSNKAHPEMLIASWLLAASELCNTNLTFCQLCLLGHLCSTYVAERLGWPQWLQIL